MEMVTCNLGFLAVHVPVSARYTSFWPIPLDSFSSFPGLLTFLSPWGLSFSLRKKRKKGHQLGLSFILSLHHFSDLHSIFLYIYYSPPFITN